MGIRADLDDYIESTFDNPKGVYAKVTWFFMIPIAIIAPILAYIAVPGGKG